MSDHHNRPAAETRKAAEDGIVIHELAVARQLLEFLEQVFDVVEKVRSLGMARHLRFLPRVEVGIDVLELLVCLLAQLADFFLHCDAAGGFEFGDLLFEIGDGLFKVEIGGNGHGRLRNLRRRDSSRASPGQGWQA